MPPLPAPPQGGQPLLLTPKRSLRLWEARRGPTSCSPQAAPKTSLDQLPPSDRQVWTSVDQPPGGLGKHSTQLAVCQALAGEAAAEESGGAPARALPLLEEAEAGLAELLPRVETSLGAARPPG